MSFAALLSRCCARRGASVASPAATLCSGPRPVRNYASLVPTSRADFARKHLSPGVGRMSDIEIVSGSGSWVVDSNGHRYLDFGTGIGVTSTGHCHPKVVKAAQEQIAKVVHAQQNISWHKAQLDLVAKMLPIVPKGLDTFFFWNSGSEAVEASIKVARQSTGKQNIIVFQGGFHGRTYGTMSLTTSKTIYRAGFGPFLSGIHVAPFPYVLHSGGMTPEACSDASIEAIELMLKQQTAPSETAAVLIEPVLGEGGYVVPPPDFLQRLRKLCDRHEMLLICDEVQSGMLRTGKYFAVEHFGIVPDILVFAKGIASGFPISGIVARHEVMKSTPPGSMGGTYGANAVSCAAAAATIDVMHDENLQQNVQARGAQLTNGLLKLKSKYPIRDVRGLGLMVGLEFDASCPPKTADAVSKACFADGMILLTTSVFETVRFIPPLTVSAAEIDTGLQIFERALQTVFSSSTSSSSKK